MPPQVPTWRSEPKQVWIKCQVVNSSGHPGELVIQFVANGEQFTSFVPEKFVDAANKRLMGFIVADFDDSWLVDIPAETLTSGPRIRIRDLEKNSVIVMDAR